MSDFSRFMKKNKTKTPNQFYAATKSLADESGEPLKWEIRPIPTSEVEGIRSECTEEIPIKGKPSLYREKIDSGRYNSALLVASVVSPDLNDAGLQDSYGVKEPDDLLKEMIDNPGEYTDFILFVQTLNGFDITLEEKIGEAKN